MPPQAQVPALLVLASLAVFGLSCAGWGSDLGVVVACDQAGALGLVKILGIAMIANQATYLISPK